MVERKKNATGRERVSDDRHRLMDDQWGVICGNDFIKEMSEHRREFKNE